MRTLLPGTVPDFTRRLARARRELNRIRRPEHGFWASRLSLLSGLCLAVAGTLGAAVWSLAAAAPGRGPDGTVIAGDVQREAPRLVQTAPGTFVFPGSAHLQWPSSGHAAIEVQGMGLMGNDGSLTARSALASIAKTMTAYVVLKDHPLAAGQSGPTITVTAATAKLYPEAIAKDESAVLLKAGERLTERQALQAMMLASAGDVADLLALWDRGSVGAFAAEMNKQAELLGMTDTDYTDPTGLAASTVSTMADQLKLAEAVQATPVLAAIVAEKSAPIPVVGEVPNINQDLGFEGIDGIKTGTTAAAGSCLLFSAHVEVGGQRLTLLGIVLGMPGSTGTPWSALKAADVLVASARAALGSAVVAAPGTPVAALVQGDGTRTGLGVAAPLKVVGWPGLSYRVSLAGSAAAPRLAVTRTGGSATAVAEPLRRLAQPRAASGKPSAPAQSAAPARP